MSASGPSGPLVLVLLVHKLYLHMPCHFKFAYLQTILLFTCTKRYACFLADYKT